MRIIGIITTSVVAVVLEDDPGGDLYDTTGRFYYFGPEEVEPLPARQDAT